MTPEEWKEMRRIKREIQKKLEDIEKRDRLMSRGTVIQQEHLAEQMEAFMKDVKSGKAFEGDHWKVADSVDAVPGLPEWIRRRRRVEWVKRKAMWAAAALVAGLILLALRWMLRG